MQRNFGWFSGPTGKACSQNGWVYMEWSATICGCDHTSTNALDTIKIP